MESKDTIKEELTQLLNTYYNGSFVQLVCDYIRSTGMTRQEMERVLEEMRKVKGA
jgi:predicted transcriptional regulator